MSRKSLVICDEEKDYAFALAGFLSKKKELYVQIQVFSSFDNLLEFGKDHPIDYLFVSARRPARDRHLAQARHTFVLTAGGVEDIGEQEQAVYKYQSGENIYRELIRLADENQDINDIFLKTVSKKEKKIIGMYSPVRRLGQTSHALRLGKELAVRYNVLYLNMETYGGADGYFGPCGERQAGQQTLSDVLYYSRQESKNLCLMISGIAGHMGGLDYIPPISVSEDLKAVTQEEWLDLISQVIEQSIYEILILDIGEGVQGILEILNICTEIHMLVSGDDISKAKIRQFEKELVILGYESVKEKIIHKEQDFDTGRRTTCPDHRRAGHVKGDRG